MNAVCQFIHVSKSSTVLLGGATALWRHVRFTPVVDNRKVLPVAAKAVTSDVTRTLHSAIHKLVHSYPPVASAFDQRFFQLGNFKYLPPLPAAERCMWDPWASIRPENLCPKCKHQRAKIGIGFWGGAARVGFWGQVLASPLSTS